MEGNTEQGDSCSCSGVNSVHSRVKINLHNKHAALQVSVYLFNQNKLGKIKSCVYMCERLTG